MIFCTYLITNEVYRVFFFFFSVLFYKKYQSLASNLYSGVKCNYKHSGCIEPVQGIYVLDMG